ncbi:hypothetical protein ACIBG4_32060 [Nonomuraea sp. NPDC050383]|uniref:hypothetical protein n=1 Tax=Nonomuraea sp. NPDC050383 TaxID=3364362 RepID=UPI00378E245A
MLLTAVLSFFAGVFGANATPHFVKGITLVNLVAGWAMCVIAALLALGADTAGHPAAAFTAAALGVLVMGVFHATVGAFGKRPPATV